MYVDPIESVALGHVRKKMGRVMPVAARNLCGAMLQQHSTEKNNLVARFELEAIDKYLRADKDAPYGSNRHDLCYAQLDDIAAICGTTHLSLLQMIAGCTNSEEDCLSEQERQFLAELDKHPEEKLKSLYDAMCIRTGCPWISRNANGGEEPSPSTRMKMAVITKASYGVFGNYITRYHRKVDDIDAKVSETILILEQKGALSDDYIFTTAKEFHAPIKWIYLAPESHSFWGYNPWAENVLCIMMLSSPKFSQLAADALDMLNPML